ncbi:polysaccharide ABC transporter ATP-binding protein [Flavobacterium sp. LB3P21]|uniref:ABC transporter ATP-binding protein n=1 Tax=Flavobacterium sp. LB3P21 TaxID=3401719 RepID=UPI003AAD40F7
MSKDIILKAENISKQYRLGQVGTGTLAHDLNRWWHQLRGKEDPYLKIGDTNDRTTKGTSDYVWALQDINFEVERGEVIGIIGKNGAGKSTLLKILSRVTAPTTGSIKFGGRVASLLEVGTGFNGEMTGRENIYLNGAILGMTKKEIASKLEEIIDFSGCERYIDTPVKRYSSGMYVRLAFAVAAFLEPEILIIDEVLAVGDAEFQKKAIGKMQEISRAGGRTVLFVSHNLLAVKSLCTKGILMEYGRIVKTGSINEVVDYYLSKSNDLVKSFVDIQTESRGFKVNSIEVSNNGIDGNFNINKDLIFEISITCKRNIEAININIFMNTIEGSTIFATCSPAEKQEIGCYIFKCIIPKNTLNDILYSIDVMVVENGPVILHSLKEVLTIEGIEEKRDAAWLDKFPGLIRPQYFEWNKTKLQ